MKKLRTIAILLALSIASGLLASCGSEAAVTDETTDPEVTTQGSNETTDAPDPFAELDFGEEEFRIFASANQYTDAASSYYYLCPTEDTGDIVNDAVVKRNRDVEELLNVKLKFTENHDNYERIGTTLTNLIMADEDVYDLIIHDLFPMASLSVQGYFFNACDNKYFDFSQDYWYEDYMLDLSFNNDDIHYLLAGDYFIDVLRSAHAMYVNKEMLEEIGRSTDTLYDTIFDGKWTHDVFLEYMAEAKLDDGNGVNDENDRYGFATSGIWGPMMPFAIGADITYLKYADDGAPSFAMNNERSVKLLENLNTIFYHDATVNFTQANSQIAEAFIGGRTLFTAYQRVSALEVFRDMKTDFGVIPYPKMDETQERYQTCSHDTANVGAIPVTTSKFEMAGAVIEVLSRESGKTVMPAYYEAALKVKYIRDDTSVMMLDIIRNNITDVFPLAFGNYCNNLPLRNAFYELLAQKRTDFVSNYESLVDGAQAQLDTLWENFSKQK